MSSVAFVFPGQGSQYVGMLSELAVFYPSLLDTFQEVSDVLGVDIWSLIQNGPEALLNQTEHTQVAMLTADVAVFTLLKQNGAPTARVMAGHSLGEYAALVCAGALRLSDAATLVAKRGQLMQKAEEIARKRDCLFMTVNTMDFEARPFYEKHGYTVEFTRSGFEKNSVMYFLRKAL